MNEKMNLNSDKYSKNPFYISDLQKYINSLSKSEKTVVILYLKLGKNNLCRWVEFLIPNKEARQKNEELYKRYFLAMVNNIVVTFGGERLDIFLDVNDKDLLNIAKSSAMLFQTENHINNRTGYGVYVNYINRMNLHLGLESFSITIKDIRSWRQPDQKDIAKFSSCEDIAIAREKLRLSATKLKEKRFCSLDIGGNSIKGAIITDGKITLLKEFCWYPTGCQTAQEILEPILSMLEFMQAYENAPKVIRENVIAGMGKEIGLVELKKAIKLLKSTNKGLLLFDAVVIGFPDIVVFNKIAGGETFKQIGIKRNFGDDYDREFSKTADLDDYAKAFVKKDGEVVVLNDANAAAFITSVEFAFREEGLICQGGMIANTIGTEMGTGFISNEGTIQYFPLEGYQEIIDLGSLEYQKYPPIDIRSTLSLSTGIPGTVQKNITQLGLFRMAIIGLMKADIGEYKKLVKNEFIIEDSDGIEVMVEPIDNRGELTKRLLELLEEGHPVLETVVESMGKSMGVLIDQSRIITSEISTTRFVSGGIVASDLVFETMLKGLKSHNSKYDLIRLDEKTTYSPLLKQMKPSQRNFNVAIGSGYIGNYALLYKNK